MQWPAKAYCWFLHLDVSTQQSQQATPEVASNKLAGMWIAAPQRRASSGCISPGSRMD